jgi:hypothetical protein
MLPQNTFHAQPIDGLTPLPAPIVERLAAEGVDSLEAWRALGPKRFQIFGVTRSMVRQLDALARAVR